MNISKKCSIYGAENISIGNHVRIDDFCILSSGEGKIKIGSYVHIAAYTSIYGSGDVMIHDFCGISSKCSLYSSSDDFSGICLTGPMVPEQFKHMISKKITLYKHVVIGSMSTIMPGVSIGEGTAIGAYSLILNDIEPWGIFVGVPAKKLKDRKRDLLKMEESLYRLTE
ncbi:galactoside O-acetyltransferase [Baia soyae]|uniref:Galactoside O-acetyltransferase n=1 Tax=Baia soyae TaxID=1544746 RepID=A0A4V2SYA7_9BACL|nr:galactoside O-acetyltransferase [Baia soyae]